MTRYVAMPILVLYKNTAINNINKDLLKLNTLVSMCSTVGNGSFRPWVVLALGRFGPGRFGLSRFGPGSFRALLVGRFGLIVSNPRIVT